VKDVIVTAVVAVVLAILFMVVLLSVAFSGWGDPSRSDSYSRNRPQAPVVAFVDSRVTLADSDSGG
jgi:hypothetical protein